jgi:hypothetical protein
MFVALVASMTPAPEEPNVCSLGRFNDPGSRGAECL